VKSQTGEITLGETGLLDAPVAKGKNCGREGNKKIGNRLINDHVEKKLPQ